jgi:hypothetical protein
MGWARHVARLGKRRGAYRDLMGEPENKGRLERPRRKRLDIIKMDLQVICLQLCKLD